ncbi:MAG TPA: hypothetical protein VMV09_07785 [Candidatus Saccharimonadales bacterium]|nr:hypothetical protein [Candidatus Saccharimonadales bacterium]
MSKLRISPTLALPLDWMTLASVVYGARGSGKTHFGGVIAEAVTKEHQRFCAIDLKGDWWGLKAGADGVSEGIPVVVFGGDHADLPLEDTAGVFVADVVAELEQSVILDLEHLSKGKQVRFLASFFERLYDKNREPLLLLADEAQRYAPQRPISPEASVCLGAVEDIVKLGRKHGVGVVLFTQRGAGLNKEVSELSDMLVAFRTPGPLDQDRIKDWLDANATREQRDQVMSKLSGLPTGTAVIASNHPGLRIFETVHIRDRETFDSSATPRIGQKRVEPKRLAQVDLEQLRDRMAATIERAKADDPKDLRRRITELERQLAQKPVAPEPVVERVEVPVQGEEDRELTRDMLQGLQDLATDLRGLSDHLVTRIEAVGQKATDAPRPQPRVLPPAPASVKRAPILSAEKSQSNGHLNGPQQAVLDALAWWEAAGVGAPTHAQVGYVAHYSAGGGYWRSIVGALSTGGLIQYPMRGSIALTVEGRARANPPATPASTTALHDMVREQLDGPRRTILDVLLDEYPNALTHEELGLRTGYSPGGGYWRSLVGRLSTLGLITYPVRGTVAAAPVLFLERA